MISFRTSSPPTKIGPMLGSIIVAALLFLPHGARAQTSTALVQEMIDAVDRDSLLAYVEHLQSFGTRYEYSPQQDSAATYLSSIFSGWNVLTQSDWFTFGTTTMIDADLVTTDSFWVAGGNGAILFSSNGGSSWIAQTTPVSRAYHYGIDMISSQVGVAVGGGGYLIRTTNAGTTWSQVPSGVSATLNSVSFADAMFGVSVGVSGTIIRTTNGGLSWTRVLIPTSRALRDVAFISASTVIAVGDSGYIFRSTDTGVTWQQQISGTTLTLYSLSFIDSQIGYICGSGSTVLKTTNSGTSWNVALFPMSPSRTLRGVLFATQLDGRIIDVNGRLFATTNGGSTWTVADSVISSGWGPYFYKLRGGSSQRMLILGSRSLIRTSTDGGATWSDRTNSIPAQYLHSSRNIIATLPGTTAPAQECVLVAHYDSYSNDPYVFAPGANDNATGTAAVMEAVRVLRNYRFARTVNLVAVAAEEFGMYGSEHYAYSAKKANRTIVGAINGDMLGYPIAGDTLHCIAGSYLQRNRLVDSAVVYNQRYGIGLSLVAVVDNTGASDYGPFALVGYDALDIAEGTANEIWGGADPFYHTPNDSASKLNFGLVRRAAQLMIASVAELAGPINRLDSNDGQNSNVPNEFSLSQNYPNPFNPGTKFEVRVAERGMMRLSVYDMLGREVAVLMNGEREAGYYTATFDASHLPSGLYLCRLQAGEFVQTRKALLIR